MTIMGGLFVSAALAACYKGWWILLLMVWSLSILINPPLNKLAVKLCKYLPAPADGCGSEN
jgi:hypothetical protein